jgi:hypothetical protein
VSTYPITCPVCGREHSKEDWLRLECRGIHLECLEIRQCQCGNTLSVEVEGFGGGNDHYGATLNMLEVL